MNELLKNVIETVTPEVKKQFSLLVKKIGERLVDLFKNTNWKEILFGDPDFPNDINIIPIEKEFLTKEALLEIAKQHIIPNSNEVLAMIGKESSKHYYIYLAYSKDREMLPQEENNFVIIKTDGLSKDVHDLFNQHELIILK